MNHPARTFTVHDVDTVDELARLLTSQRWTLDTGFRCRGHFFLNDSLSEQGPFELAVVRERDLVQSERIRVNRCTFNDLRLILWAIVEADFGVDGDSVGNQIVWMLGSHRARLSA